MEDCKFRLLMLHRAKGASRPFIRKILRQDPYLDNLLQLSPVQFSTLFSLHMNRARLIYDDLHDKKIVKEIIADHARYPAVTIYDPAYPPLLKTIPDAPLVLYTSGNIELFQQLPSLSVVGTRKPSNTAFKKMDKILSPLLKEDWLIVSGMAEGIDGYAHRMACRENKKTIAVLGGGFHHIYPKSHLSLFHELSSTQLAISEYPPDLRPFRYHFPERNRIVSGLSFATLVVEAQEKSGSLITVDQALEQGREVYAIPGSPLSPFSDGCNKMIQEGAKLVQKSYDLLEDWQEMEQKWTRTMSEYGENVLNF